MILITGGTGTSGREILRQLLAAGTPVRALVRDPGRAGDLRRLGAELVQGDLADPRTLDDALRGVRRALLASAWDPRQSELQENFVAAAERAGLRRLVKLSGQGADPGSPVNVSRWHGAVEERMRAGSVPWTFLRPTFFMQNLLGQVTSIAHEGRFYAPAGEARAAFVDVRDIAAVAVRALLDDGHEGKAYEITGPEALTHAEMAARISEPAGHRVEFVDVTPEDFRASLRAAGSPDWYVEGLDGLFGMLRSGRSAVVTPVVREVGGKEPTSFARFAADFAASFARH